MAERVSKGKSTKKAEEDTKSAENSGDEQAQAVSEETDDLLDEIDAVLESNAEEFVKGYVQKGGE